MIKYLCSLDKTAFVYGFIHVSKGNAESARRRGGTCTFCSRWLEFGNKLPLVMSDQSLVDRSITESWELPGNPQLPHTKRYLASTSDISTIEYKFLKL